MLLYTKLFALFDKYGIKQVDLKPYIGNETLRKLKLFNTYQDENCKKSSFCYGITLEEINKQLLESAETPKITNSKGKEVNHPYVNRTIDSRTFDEICRWLTNLIREKEGNPSILIQPDDIMEYVEDTPEVLEVTKSKKQISD